jgi:antitoxin FitA
MKTLHLHNIPDSLYEKLQSLARSQKRSLNAQVIAMLEQAIERQERRRGQREALDSIRSRRFKPPANAPSSLDLLREDRGQ